MAAAKTAATEEVRWRHLKRAHTASQPDPWRHTCSHLAMLTLTQRQHDWGEAFGQVIRIVVAASGLLTGRYPEGNTGRVAAGLTTPMPVPPDLTDALHR